MLEQTSIDELSSPTLNTSFLQNLSKPASVSASFYLALFLTTMTTLLYQMLLTRIFSVTMWYHFAFVAISLAMFGIAAGAIRVFLAPQIFTQASVPVQMARYTLLFSVSIVFCLLTHLSIPFRVSGIVGIYSLAFTYFIGAIPFVMSGVTVCLALTKFPEKLSRLYAIDLLGAGLGCILLIPLLRILDGPTAIIMVSSVAALGAFFFAYHSGNKTLKTLSLIWSLVCLLFVIGHSKFVQQQKPLLRIMYVKGLPDPPRLYEKWNAFSSIRVFDNPSGPSDPNMPKQLQMNIDAAGGTPITAFDGDLSKMGFLKKSAINLAQILRPNSKLLVIGPGGGIDVLSGLALNQKSITAVEINDVILDTVNNRFGDFTGHLDRYSNISFIHDEARSYITRSLENFDIIHANVIDTWAAGAAGAFALTENSLYTAEAWTEYLKHLNPNGIITFTRWYFYPFPDEIYRLTSMAVEALKAIGIEDTRNHIILVTPKKSEINSDWNIGTILVCKDPFSKEDLAKIEALSREIPFDIKLSPSYAVDENFSTIANGKNLGDFYHRFEFDITPPTDDKPFFFHRYKMSKTFSLFFKKVPASASGDNNVRAVIVLGVLLVTVILLVSSTILFPLFLKTRASHFSGHLHLLLYFTSIGIAFMMIEISQLQRLSIFLGHPTYSLSVVLFSLLIGSGLGSFCSQKFIKSSRVSQKLLPFSLLLLTIGLFGFLTPLLIHKFTSSTLVGRILISIFTIVPLGFFMGMPFTIGMSSVLNKKGSPSAWFWGINGSASVCASVLAIACSITWGISASFWIGGFFYLLSFICILIEFSKSPKLPNSSLQTEYSTD